MTDLEGNLRGNPLAGSVHLELAGNRYNLPRLDLRSGSARLAASGTFSKTAGNLDWKLDAPNLGEALPQAGGSVALQGNLSGPWQSPHVRAQGNGQSLVYQTYTVATLALNADVDLATQGPILLDVNATNVGMGDRRFETVAVNGRGTRQSHAVTLAVKAQEGSLDLGLAGGLQGGDFQKAVTWNGKIQRLDLRNEQTGTGRSPDRPVSRRAPLELLSRASAGPRATPASAPTASGARPVRGMPRGRSPTSPSPW